MGWLRATWQPVDSSKLSGWSHAFLDTTNINKESIAGYLRGIFRHELPANVQQLQLSLRAEQIDTAYYHYSHGLKKHDGNCQRIVHEGVGKGAIAISNWAFNFYYMGKTMILAGKEIESRIGDDIVIEPFDKTNE